MSLVKRFTGSRRFQKAVGVMAAEYLRLVWKTTGFVVEPEGILEQAERDFPVILGVWHGQHYLFPFVRRSLKGDHPVKVLVSRHRDGEINAIAAERLGIGTIRGSGNHRGGFAHKGGVGAFYQMAAALEQGCSVTLTADVPKVARRAGEGIVRLAAVSGRPIYVASVATRNHLTLDTWDRTEVNLPFGPGAFVGQGPFHVPPDPDADALESARRTVEAALNAVSARAHALADGGAVRG
jgi:lysophospholipid acyltransferase (LPLAT)-like uncharacterized protein